MESETEKEEVRNSDCLEDKRDQRGQIHHLSEILGCESGARLERSDQNFKGTDI
jgi:hypothetical protein